MSAQPTWKNLKRARVEWPSDIWPFRRLPLAGRRQRIQDTNQWEFEPSGHVGELEVVAGDEPLTADLEFRQQKEAFNRIPPLVLIPYRGRFVASYNGEIVDSDDNLAELTRRFFGERGDVPVYITKIGEPIRITISTPLFR